MPAPSRGGGGQSSGGSCAIEKTAQATISAMSPPSSTLAHAEDVHRPRTGERRGRRGGEHRRDDQPDRRRDREPDVRAVEKDAGRRQRVEAEEPGARQERQRDQRQARVTEAAGRDVRHVREDDVHRRGDEHEPEVARVVLPLHVELGLGQEHGQPKKRQDEDETDRPQASRRPLSQRLSPWSQDRC